MAASLGNASIVEMLALAGADINASDFRGSTAIGLAASKGHLDVVEVSLIPIRNGT